MKSLSIALLLLTGLCSGIHAETGLATKYLRIVGLGNSQNRWNSISEVVFPEVPYSSSDITIRASGHDNNLPEYSMDGDLGTRFSVVGPGQWISYEFPEVCRIGSIEIAFTHSDIRTSYFYVEQSMDNENWSPVYLGTTTEGNPGFETIIFSEDRQTELQALLSTTDELHERTRLLYAEYMAERAQQSTNPLVVRYFDLLAWLENSFDRKLLTPYKSPFHYTLAEVEEVINALEQHQDFLNTTDIHELWWAHYSVPDDSTQPFILRIPDQFDPTHSYPLVVELHGHGVRPKLGDKPEKVGDFFHVIPLLRGDNRYEGIGEVTVLELVDYMVRAFPIDVRKIHITGESMGGNGTWNMATRHADLFASAAPYYGYGQGLYLQNLRQMPLYISHGLEDFVVPSDISRYVRDILDSYGIPSVYNEYPGEGHSARNMETPYAWESQYINTDRDREFEFTTDHPFRGKHYWAHIRAMENPRQQAVINAMVTRAAVELKLDNISVLEIDPDTLPVSSSTVKFRINGDVHKVKLQKEDSPLLIHKTGSAYRIVPSSEKQPEGSLTYIPGGAGNLYTGDPLLIVYGTGGQPEKAEALKALASEVALHCTPMARMAEGAFPVKADVDVGPGDLAHYNIMLIGGPSDNSISAMVHPSLPVSEKNGKLIISSLPGLPMDDLWYGIYHYNPISPRKHLYLANLDHIDVAGVQKLHRQLALLIPGMSLRNPLATPDFIAVSKGKIARRLQYDSSWSWHITGANSTPIPGNLLDRKDAETEYARIIRETCGTDFALVSVRDLSENYPLAGEYFSEGDFLTDNRSMPAFIGEASADQVRSILDQLVSKGMVTCYPQPGDLKPGKTYTLALNPDSFWTIRNLNYNFKDVRSGPEIGPHLLLEN